MTSGPDRSIAWLLQLARSWDEYNRDYLASVLSPVAFRLTDSRSELGRWLRGPRIIEVSQWHILEAPWTGVLATLRHEMAHQYAHEVLGAADELPHGEAFRRACRLLRVDPAASASLGGESAEAERTRSRIEKLLALGGSPNENEATAAMRKARHLMLEHNLESVRGDGERSFGVRVLGRVCKRHKAWELTLGGILGEFFFVEVIWAPYFDAITATDGKALHAYGTPANLAMAEYVHGYLSAVVEDLWIGFKRTHGLRRDRERSQYQDGVMLGFGEKLRQQERELVAQSTALMWRGDPRLSAYYRWHNPHVRSGSGRTVALTDAHVAGRVAGRGVALHRPLREDGGSSGRLLDG
ncbi:MAG: DUF2786 domain-containing protein [Planctomycetota bacterium]